MNKEEYTFNSCYHVKAVVPVFPLCLRAGSVISGENGGVLPFRVWIFTDRGEKKRGGGASP